jgi:hypothetical protein
MGVYGQRQRLSLNDGSGVVKFDKGDINHENEKMDGKVQIIPYLE